MSFPHMNKPSLADENSRSPYLFVLHAVSKGTEGARGSEKSGARTWISPKKARNGDIEGDRIWFGPPSKIWAKEV